jgi:snRNA-activating protein complex subunit 1
VDVQDIKHISEDKKLIGDEMQKIVDDWNVQRDIFNQQRGFSQQPPEEQQQLLLLQEEEQQQQQQQQQHQDDEDFDQEDEDFDQLERLLSKA